MYVCVCEYFYSNFMIHSYFKSIFIICYFLFVSAMYTHTHTLISVRFIINREVTGLFRVLTIHRLFSHLHKSFIFSKKFSGFFFFLLIQSIHLIAFQIFYKLISNAHAITNFEFFF